MTSLHLGDILARGREPENNCLVTFHSGTEFIGEHAQVLLEHKVPDLRLFTLEPDLAEHKANRLAFGASVKQNHSNLLVRQLSSPNLRVYKDALADSAPLLAQLVLVDSNNFFVSEDLKRTLAHVVHIAPDQQRRFQQRPKCKVGCILIVSHLSVSDFEHIWVIPILCTDSIS